MGLTAAVASPAVVMTSTFLPAFAWVVPTLLSSGLVMVTSLLPSPPPCRRPLGRALAPPVPPFRRWRMVVAHGHREDRLRNELGRHDHPRPIVPGGRIPPAVREDVVATRVEEVVGLHRRRVHDRAGGHHDQLRRSREIDRYIHAH